MKQTASCFRPIWWDFLKCIERAKCYLGFYLLFGYQDLNIYYVPIGCVFIAINPEGPIRSLGLAEE